MSTPPRPILTSLLNICGGLILVASPLLYLANLQMGLRFPPAVALAASLAGVTMGLIYIGIGQCVGYMASAAFYAQRAAGSLSRMEPPREPGKLTEEEIRKLSW